MSDNAYLLNLVLFFPLVGAVALAFLPKDQPQVLRNTAFGVSLATLAASVALFGAFDATDNARMQLGSEFAWIPALNIQFKTGVDGISLCMILLTTVLSSIAILSSFRSITEKVKEYYVCLLLLETGMLGVFCSLDLILFYVFWEAMLIPMYFLIGIWGGARKLYATIKFVLYTLVGSLLMLVAILWVYSRAAQAGFPTFDITRLTAPDGPIVNSSALDSVERTWLFLAFAVAFAIKVPMFPFHTWLPDAHVEAPTAGSVILAGVLLKMGTYGFVRFCIPLFPDVALKAAPYILVLSVIGIMYGALVAYVQQDAKRLVAYSSVSHLGFCMLGLFAFTREAVMGSVLQMINHGLSTGALFLIVGIIYERRHTREIAQFGGLWKVIPLFATVFLITMLSSVGLPGLNGFVGEFLILLGAFGSPKQMSYTMWAAILGATGVILGAVYMLWMFQRMMQGPLDNPENRTLRDLSPREMLTLAPLVLGMFWIGIQPNSVLRLFDGAIHNTVVRPVQEVRAREAAQGQPLRTSLKVDVPGGPSLAVPASPAATEVASLPAAAGTRR